ncbi:hypothetical protein LY78DRAFT_652935 [Colletotrichum sublineola]|nr:hypothetical protein LY78DRAFT_652935 [Colletotrichum sublineola]
MTEAAEPQRAPVVAEAHLVDTFRKPERTPISQRSLLASTALAPEGTEPFRRKAAPPLRLFLVFHFPPIVGDDYS